MQVDEGSDKNDSCSFSWWTNQIDLSTFSDQTVDINDAAQSQAPWGFVEL